jgi:uncharacterized LabA/DUF88 family protein
MKKVIAYIDWFNFYHGIHRKLPDYYKWIDYRKIVQQYLAPDEVLLKICFFTATPRYDERKIKRHNNYIDVLKKHLNIDIIEGNFTSTRKTFHLSNHPIIWPENAVISPTDFCYATFEEKQTDVNMALEILEWWFCDKYDKAIIFSWDSDIAPAIVKVKKLKKNKEFMAVLPYKWKWRVISSVCWKSKTITWPILAACVLPQKINIFWKEISCPYWYPQK